MSGNWDPKEMSDKNSVESGGEKKLEAVSVAKQTENPSTYPIGSFVRVYRLPSKRERSNRPYWKNSMDCLVGEIGLVIRSASHKKWPLVFFKSHHIYKTFFGYYSVSPKAKYFFKSYQNPLRVTKNIQKYSKMTTFGDRMRKLADISASSLPSKYMTEGDRVKIQNLMVEKIEEEARKGNYTCSFRIDTYTRANDKDKGKQKSSLWL